MSSNCKIQYGLLESIQVSGVGASRQIPDGSLRAMLLRAQKKCAQVHLMHRLIHIYQ